MKDKRAAKGKERSKARRQPHDHGADEPCSHEGHGASTSKARKAKRRVKSTRNGTMVITKTETVEEEEHGKDEDGGAGGPPDSSDDDDDDGEAERRKRNAYERGVM